MGGLEQSQHLTGCCPGSLERTLFSVAVLQSERGKVEG